ncbi:fibronectin type III domain-containing protein [Thecamonas trahens ATCC 50062]|uniref:Fibronectin type III domain-containing protein n=1 Tax=Thecamonas trahens ATCC 50062 TaxID=461836 RepID=A0A0L0D4D2_THETB|nr:fibronectin type III domain-containing protein [Thecamonas trahens ATCC 50062]KNC46966.1 fibronectin type III domain-containing protein [Thecamonas trahens ATCC 50062]|eukprot:XP_013760237.1 fibronectin type III domain-containing protein [Thecamonas trahens ATCC 50062]
MIVSDKLRLARGWDVVIGCASSATIVLVTNDGSATFAPPTVIASEFVNGIAHLTTALIDADAHWDLVAASAGNSSVVWIRNIDSAGSFAAPQLVADNLDAVAAVAVGDVNGDGSNDVVAAVENAQQIVWIANNGTGTFALPLVIDSGSLNGVRAVALGDINGDGRLDVAATPAFEDVVVWYANHVAINGTFSSRRIAMTATDDVSDVVLADLDSDGILDIAAVSLADDKLAWARGVDGAGTFSPQIVVSTALNGARSVIAVDVDSDGDLDLVASAVYANMLYWAENVSPARGFGPAQRLAVDFTDPSALAVADIDGDGRRDIIASSAAGTGPVAWFRNTPPSSTWSSDITITSTADGIRHITVADIDADGDLDVVYVNYGDDSIRWVSNTNGAADFADPRTITTVADGVTAAAAADIDNDGDLDLVSVSERDSKVAWYENLDGRGSFGPQQVITTTHPGAFALRALDFDHSGSIDIIYAAVDDDSIVYLSNTDGRGSFASPVVVNAACAGAASVAVADLNDDSEFDVIVACRGSDKVEWHAGVGDGSFGPAQPVETTLNRPVDVQPADMDADGDIDVVIVASLSAAVVWRENSDSAGTFTTTNTIASGVDLAGIASVTVADFDLDGDLDIAVAIFDENVFSWFENYASGVSWSSKRDMYSGSGAFAITAADIDADGDSDLIVGTQYSDKLVMLTRYLRGPFHNYSAPAVAYAPTSLACSSAPHTLACITESLGALSWCEQQTLLLPSADFVNCRRDTHILIERPVALAPLSSSGRVAINCTAAGGGVTFRVTPHSSPLIDTLGHLAISGIDIVGMTTGRSSLYASPGIRADGAGVRLRLAALTVSPYLHEGRGGALLASGGAELDLAAVTMTHNSASFRGGRSLPLAPAPGSPLPI